MQIFLPYKEPYKVAEVLDKRRLNKQIIEADWILSTLQGKPVSRSLPKHPIVLMYKGHEKFVQLYKDTLSAYRGNYFEEARILSKEALKYLPEFITQEYLDYFKGRLYTKDNSLYCQFKIPYKVEYSMYYFNNKWNYYFKSKPIKKWNLIVMGQMKFQMNFKCSAIDEQGIPRCSRLVKESRVINGKLATKENRVICQGVIKEPRCEGCNELLKAMEE